MTIKMRLFYLLLLLFCKVLAVWSIRPPQIDGEDELVVEEGSPFTLRCQGAQPVNWYKEGIMFDGYRSTSLNSTQDDKDFPYVVIANIMNSYPDDTGYFYCKYNDTTDLSDNGVDSVYVYVHSEYEPFVKHYLNQQQLNVSQKLQLECMTTHPNTSVTLLKDQKNITHKEGVKFDPKKGFVIENVTEDDQGVYICLAKDAENYPVELKQKVKVIAKQLKPPSIEVGKNQQFVIGEKFSLVCSVRDQEDIKFNWTYPNKAIKHEQTSSVAPRNETTYHKSTLMVLNASEAETGIYTCSIFSQNAKSNKNFYNIKVKEHVASFVKLDSSNKIPEIEGQNAKWKTTVRCYPCPPNITYTDWRGQTMSSTDRIKIEYEDHEGLSWLRINNISSSDFGHYTITAVTFDGTKKDSRTTLFEVKSPLHMKVKDILPYFVKGEKVNVTFSAQGFPICNISVLFQNCSNTHTSSCSDISSIQPLWQETDFPAQGNIIEKSITIAPDTSGLLWFITEEEDCGSQNKSAVIKISDIKGVFVFWHSGPDNITDVVREESIIVVENDEFSLMCGGIKYDYKSVDLSVDSGFPNSFRVDSEFSWQTNIIVEKATKNLAGNYTCTAYHHGEKKPDVKNIIITVDDEKLVQFDNKTNMNNQSVEVEDDKQFSLECIVTGSPTPTIQWLKDKKNLTINSKNFDKNMMYFSNDMMNLTFKHVSEKHEGEYTCMAKNRLNEVSRFLTLKKPVPGLGTTAKVILIIAFVGILILFIVVCLLMCRVKNERKKSESFRKSQRIHFDEGNIDSLNPDATVDGQAEMLPYNKSKWEVPRANITFGKQLGAGAFGRVIKALVKGLEGPATTTVAIKMSKNAVDVSQMHALVSELKIMSNLGKHLNIVNLMGANTEKYNIGELWILTEYCRFGNILNFIQKHRRKFTSQICPVTGKINPNLALNSPMSPTINESYPSSPPVDQDGYLATGAKQFVLYDPPAGHSTGSDSSSAMLTSSAKDPISLGPSGHFATNPLYDMKIGTATANPKGKPEGCEDSTNSSIFQRKGSRLLSIGSITLSDGSSVSYPLRHQDTGQQSSCQSPLASSESFFMGENYSDFLHEIGSVPGVTAPFTTSDLICWGWQMANGMNYLSRRKILHGDLAARNLLLADNNVVKISDFGLSRNMYRNDNYIKKGDVSVYQFDLYVLVVIYLL
nr:receptor tyrosine kinase PVR2A1b [Carcinus maenas]